MTKNEQARLFKVTLSDRNGAVRGRPTRKIAISAKASLYDLAAVTIESFDFDLDHSFGFYDNLKDWTSSEEGYESFADVGAGDRFPGVRKAKISKVFHTPKQKMLLLFDYGDEWKMIVQYLEETDVNPGQKLPMIMESTGDAPDQYDFEDDEDEYEDEEV